MNEGLVQRPQEPGIDHRGRKTCFLKQGGCGKSRRHHGAVGNDHQVVTFPQQFSTADRQGFPTLFHQGHAFTRSPGNAQGCRSVVTEAGHQHLLQLSLILRSHHREIGNGTHVADVVLTLVRRPIGTNDASTIQNEGDR